MGLQGRLCGEGRGGRAGCGKGRARTSTRRRQRDAATQCARVQNVALGAPRLRTLAARRNANACHRAWVRLAINRTRLGFARKLMDKGVRPGDQACNAD